MNKPFKYNLKFENGRKCTIECDTDQTFQDKINDAEIRFNSECVEINDKPIKKHSLGGFLVGATIGAILGNSVPKKTISKTASGVKRTAKNVTKSVKTNVRSSRKKISKDIDDIFFEKNEVRPSRKRKSKDPDDVFQARESRKFSGGGTTDDERYCRLAEDTGKGVNEGYVVGMGETIYENEDNLVKHLRSLDYEDADGNSSKKIKSKEDLLEFFYNDEYYYWTEWDCDAEIEDQGYYYTRDGKEIEIASKGKKIKSKINKKYTHFAVNKETGKIRDGWETLSDVEELKYYANLDLKDNDLNPKDFNILSAKTLLRRGIDPYDSDNWQQVAYETGGSSEKMARGSKIKTKNNTQAVKGLVKDLENTPYSIGLAILRERLLTYSENDLRSLEKNPDAWKNPIISLGMYKDYYSRVAKELSFDSGKDNTKAVKGLVKDLENTPYSIGLAILRERLLAYAENDLKAMQKNPDAWKNPFISLGMYKDYANRVIDNLKFEYATGGLIVHKEDGSEIVGIESKEHESSLDEWYKRPTNFDESRNPEYISRVFNSGKAYLYNFFDKYGNKYEYDELVEKPKFATGGDISSVAMAGAVPELAIADQVSKRLPATTSAIDRRLAERIYSEKPKWYEDRGMQYAGGGKVGDEITFKHWSGDIKTGTIKEDLGDGNFDVSSGWGSVLVNKDDIISGGSKFSGGGFVPNGYVTLIFNGKPHDFPAIYEKVGDKVVLEDVNLVSGLDAQMLLEFLNNEFHDWLESSNPSSEYEDMYFGEEATMSKSNAIYYAIELISEDLYEKKNQNNQPAVLNLDKYESDYLTAFEG